MMAFSKVCGIAAPLAEANVNTDKIIPAEYLKTVTREGLGNGLLAALRRDPDFVLNRAPWNRAEILIALDNFGCGSSREHAPWALLDFGIRCVIAPSFADIFYNNCFKNGILAVVLPRSQVHDLIVIISDPARARLEVDLERQIVTAGRCAPLSFDIDLRRKTALLCGLDETGRTLGVEERITEFEVERRRSQPWFPWFDPAIAIEA